MNARHVTLRDHLEIETEGSVSPIQAEVSAAARDAEARKERLTLALQYYIQRREAITIELERINEAEAETRAELAELS